MQLILGGGRSDASSFIFKKIIQKATANPYDRFFIVVPEQYTLEAQKKIVDASINGCILNIEVVSFELLGYKIMAELGISSDSIISEEAKVFLLGKVGKEVKDELRVFGRNIRKVGYLEELQSIISEFTQYNVSSENINGIMQNTSINPKFKEKLSDISIIRNAYVEALHGENIPKEELLLKLCDVIKESKLVKDAIFAFDGYTGFNPDQMAFLKNLLKACKESYMTVVFPKELDYERNLSDTDTFSLSRKTILDIEKLCIENCIPFNKPITLDDNPETKESFLIKEASIPLEVERIKHEIIKLIRQGYDYKDIGIICLDSDSYAKYFQEIFTANKIPYFINERGSLLTHSFAQFFRYALSINCNNFSRDSVFKYLKSGYSKLDYDDICFLENYVVSLGIKGYNAWHESFARKPKYINEDELSEKLVRLNNIRQEFIDEVDPFIKRIKSAKTFRDYSDSLRFFFEYMNAQKTLEDLALAKEDEDPLKAVEYRDVLNLSLEIIDTLDRYMGKEEVSINDYISYLELGLSQKKMKMTPPSVNQVIIGDMDRTRFGDIKVLFITGASDDNLPGNINRGGIITDTDRTFLKENGILIAPTARELIGRARFYFYFHTCKPSEKLYFTYSVVNGSGEDRDMSFFIKDYGRKNKILEVPKDLEEVLTIDEALKLVSSLFESKKDDETLISLYSYLLNDYEIERKLGLILDGAEHKKVGDKLSKEISDKLYENAVESSISKLNKYAACPYRYFLEYSLGLKKREEYTYTGADDGSLIHNILNEFRREVKKENKHWKELSDKDIDIILDKAVENGIGDYRNTLLQSTKRNEYILTHIKDLVKYVIKFNRDKLSIGSYEEYGSEVFFNGEKDKDMMLDLGDNKNLILRGSVDRVDISKGETNLVSIIDYKTGNKKISLNEVYDGLDLQLPIYAKAVLSNLSKKTGKQTVLSGFEYSPVKDVLISKDSLSLNTDEKIVKDNYYKELKGSGYYTKEEDYFNNFGDRNEVAKYYDVKFNSNNSFHKNAKVLSQEDLEVLMNYAMHKAKENGKRIVSGDISIEPAKDCNSSCKYCDYKGICRFGLDSNNNTYKKTTKEKDDEIIEMMKEELKLPEDND